MLRVFCCRSRRASNVEEDRITDSLEACLSHELGVNEFQKFLVTNRLEDDTLQVFLECNRILREIDKLSPGGKAGKLPDHIQTAISRLYEMTQRINLDSGQLNALENLRSNDINVKKIASKTNPENLHYEAEDHECYITVQEIRRVGGQCVKIRDNFQGCVAGSLMDPFHQDCL